MHNVHFHTARATEGKIMEIIFNAARANETRCPRVQGEFSVAFNNQYTPDGEYLALVTNQAGQVCGSAVVDKFDC